MPSERPSASTVDADAAPAPLSSPRWKKPSSGPLPRMGDGNQDANPSPLAPPSRRSELKRRLRALAAAEDARGSRASVHVDGGLDDVQRVGPAGVHGAVETLWSDADEVKLLAAAAAFRKRTGRAPRRPDTGALFDAIRDSISLSIDAGEAYDKLNRFETKFLYGALGASDGAHDRRVRELCANVWGVVDVMSPSEDDSDGEEVSELDAGQRRVADAGERGADERCLDTERKPKPAPTPRRDAPMPSERPSISALAMDVDAAPAPPSPPRSKKLPSHPQPSVGDGHPGPDPSPQRARTSAEMIALALAAAAAARGSDSGDVGHGAVQSPEPADDGGHGAARNHPKTWSDADEITLLTAAAAFRERTDRVPRDRDAAVLFSSIRGSISPHINEAKVSYKLGRFRGMFRHEAPGESATTHDRRVHDLSAKVWGVVGVAAPDAGPMMPVVTEVLGEYWKMNERAMTGLPLEKGLLLIGKEQGGLIETKWRQQLDEEMQTQMRRHDLAKEICGLLNDTIKGFDP